MISTHTSLAGRDRTGAVFNLLYDVFLLTRPSRDVTTSARDRITFSPFLLTRPSRDVTRMRTLNANQQRFLLTRPSRDVTNAEALHFAALPISTHTSLAGRDRYILYTMQPFPPTFRDGQIKYTFYTSFNPRSRLCFKRTSYYFQIIRPSP